MQEHPPVQSAVMTKKIIVHSPTGRSDYTITLDPSDVDNLTPSVRSLLLLIGWIEDTEVPVNNGPRYSDGRVYSDAYDDSMTVTVLTSRGRTFLQDDALTVVYI